MPSNPIEPGEIASITLTTNPESFVALLAVDQKVSILNTGNDIDLDQIADASNSFYFHNVFNESAGESIYSLLGKSNAFLLTNANGGKPSCSSSRFGGDNDKSKFVSEDGFMSDQPWNGQENEKIATKISETWIFESIKIGSSGQQVIKRTVPESFTSYVITAFSMNPIVGLGIAQQKVLSISKDFFVEFDLPREISVGDVLKVRIFVYIFMKNSRIADAQITLTNKGDFELLELGNSRQSCSYMPSTQSSKRVKLTQDGATEVSFYIRPISEGFLNLKVSATSQNLQDVATKQIDVKFQGFSQGKSSVKLLDLRTRKFDGFYFDMTIEEDAIKSSVQTEGSVVGDLMGAALENADKLL